MLCLSKKTEYALVALAHLAEQPERLASAREIASAHGLPAALLMNILKNLQGHGLLCSGRGVKGGYRIAQDLGSLPLYDLIAMVECGGQQPEGDCGCLDHVAEDVLGHPDFARFAGSRAPVQALQFKLVRFLKEVRVADLVMPGRRIDVPLERLKIKEHQANRRISHAHHAQ
jgi:Rrf2 family protein